MNRMSSSLEGELLIRSILYRRTALNSGVGADMLRIKADSTPCPTVPQIAVKAGVRRLEIAAEDDVSDGSVSQSFQWQGIDGMQIDTCVQCAEELFEGSAVAGGRHGAAPPTWYGELPAFQNTPARSDERNRCRLAAALRNAEFLNVIRPSGLANYPLANLRAAWTALLVNSAGDSYAQSDQSLLQAISAVERNAAAMAEIAAAIDTRGLKRPVLVLNNNSFYANEAVTVPLAPGEKPITATGPEGDAEKVQILENPNGDGTNYALFVAMNVPLHGYAVWDLGATLTPTEWDDEVTVSPSHLENSSVRIEFDHASGLILKILDKDSERDLLNETFEVQRNGKRDILLQSCANLLEVTVYGDTTAAQPVTRLDRVEVLEAGPVRAGLAFNRTLPGGTSTIRQIVRLTSRSARIDFVTEVDWHDEDRMLAVSFPVAINSHRATYEIPCGHIERPTRWNEASKPTQLDGHKWVDISEGDYGVAVLNNAGLYCDVRGNRLRLHICSNSNINHIEPSVFRFTYSLLPHGGGLRDSEVVENSYAINNPPLCTAITGNGTGNLLLERSFFEVDSASVFIESTKRAENEEHAIIVRLYEAHNTRGVVLLSTALAVKRAWLCDLLENNLAEIPLDNGEALLPFHPFEIITVKYTLCN